MCVDDAVENMKQMNPQWSQYHDTVASWIYILNS